MTREQAIELLEDNCSSFRISTGWTLDEIVNAILAAYKKGRKDAAPQWIPCSERMPKRDDFVLAYNGMTSVRWLDDFEIMGVTHWMPLPEAPK